MILAAFRDVSMPRGQETFPRVLSSRRQLRFSHSDRSAVTRKERGIVKHAIEQMRILSFRGTS